MNGPQQPKAKPKTVNDPPQPGSPGARHITTRILVADDSTVVRENLRKLIRSSLRYAVVLESDTVRSTISRIGQYRPDTVILDLQLPDGSGFEVLQHLQENRTQIAPPMVIVLTAFAGKTQRERSIRLGASYFLDKATDYEQLLEILS